MKYAPVVKNGVGLFPEILSVRLVKHGGSIFPYTIFFGEDAGDVVIVNSVLLITVTGRYP